MRKKIVFSALTIVLAAAMIVGGTMAWFTSSVNGGETTFTAGTVQIEAGQEIDIPDDDNHTWIEGDIFPRWVVAAEQGQRFDGSDVLPSRSNPNVVLTDDNQQEGENFYSLGFDGYIVVEFDHLIFTGEKVSIITVVEETGGRYPLEKANIYVSTTGNEDDWVYIDVATNDGTKVGNTIKNTFELPKDVDYARYIKLVDITDKEDFKDLSNKDKNAADGFDVNVIYVEGGLKDKDHNWNPGDTATKEYTVVNTGSKDIHVRAQLIGQWYQYNEETYEWVTYVPIPDLDVVEINVCEVESPDWFYDEASGYFYYTGELAGTYERSDEDIIEATLCVEIHIKGEETDNQYQGKRFVISTTFEAIQSSNGAAEEHWQVNLYSFDE
ncbi:SipW-dependent-type signal peptide-containing protein [Alkaliphilus serpentinus]|uniref:SipW-dependent-type signal peptide-containing protein n=1 Tax=Alkaliphilus serpentinus TaxID=1482731 RepID=UPI0018657323|nr:SipW-dependent-type signal peptide-containing protein [Alkaliphilus serpentinus]